MITSLWGMVRNWFYVRSQVVADWQWAYVPLLITAHGVEDETWIFVARDSRTCKRLHQVDLTRHRDLNDMARGTERGLKCWEN